jgi:hypothetical protein
VLVGRVDDGPEGQVARPHAGLEVDQGIDPESPPAEDVDWINAAVGIVVKALDQLVFEFLRAPYLHRVDSEVFVVFLLVRRRETSSRSASTLSHEGVPARHESRESFQSRKTGA